MPARLQPCPYKAACWSPSTAVTGICLPNIPCLVTPKSPSDGLMVGNMVLGISNNSNNSSDQSPVCKDISMVRDALVISMLCSPVMLNSSQLSTVPKANSPASACWRSLGFWFNSHTILLALKYGSIRNPVICWILASKPLSRQSLHHWWVRLSCQTMAGATGLPVFLCQIMVVSRWLVIPMAEISVANNPALAITSWAVLIWVCQMSLAFCSINPAFGVMIPSGFWAMAMGVNWLSKMILRLEVVPWSSAKINPFSVLAMLLSQTIVLSVNMLS